MNEIIKLTFEQRIIQAALCNAEGDPLKDFLDEEDITDAVLRLADVYTALGFKMPEEPY